MNYTTDEYTGKRFYFNTTVHFKEFVVPCRETDDNETFLHPARVPEDLLRHLNREDPELDTKLVQLKPSRMSYEGRVS